MKRLIIGILVIMVSGCGRRAELGFVIENTRATWVSHITEYHAISIRYPEGKELTWCDSIGKYQVGDTVFIGKRQ